MTDISLLLDNAAVTGDPRGFGGGRYCFAVDGTFGGATVTLQMLSPDGSSYIAVPNTALTTEGMVTVDLPSNSYRALVASGTPSALFAFLRPISK